MNTYHCKLVNKKGYVEKSFFREAYNEREVTDYLEMFEWPKGSWEINLEGV